MNAIAPISGCLAADMPVDTVSGRLVPSWETVHG
jgi:hypothetical protein